MILFFKYIPRFFIPIKCIKIVKIVFKTFLLDFRSLKIHLISRYQSSLKSLKNSNGTDYSKHETNGSPESNSGKPRTSTSLCKFFYRFRSHCGPTTSGYTAATVGSSHTPCMHAWRTARVIYACAGTCHCPIPAPQ